MKTETITITLTVEEANTIAALVIAHAGPGLRAAELAKAVLAKMQAAAEAASAPQPAEAAKIESVKKEKSA